MADDIKALVLPALQLAYEQQRHGDALAMLDELLAGKLLRETRCALHAYRALVLAHAGRYDDELRDLEEAHAMSTPQSFRRYGIEIGLATNALNRGDAASSTRWRERADATLRTVPLHEREDVDD